MHLGINWFSFGVLAVIYILGQIRTIPVRVRYGIYTAGYAAIALNGLRMGAVGINLVFVALAGALCLYYAVKAIRTNY